MQQVSPEEAAQREIEDEDMALAHHLVVKGDLRLRRRAMRQFWLTASDAEKARLAAVYNSLPPE